MSGGPGTTVAIPGRFNGPRESGNGGYCCGVFAEFVDGPAAVMLRSPVPLGTRLGVEREPGRVRILDGEQLVAEAEQAPELELDVPRAPSLEEARDASTRYLGEQDGLFSRCFVCGPDREDAYGVFAGAVAGRELVASPWVPGEETSGSDGAVRPELVWAVLDCPTYFACHPGPELPIAFLARMQARLLQPVPVGEPAIAAAWEIGRDGRKLSTGSAVYSAAGEVLAVAEVLIIEARAG